jgi:hypothetical protein
MISFVLVAFAIVVAMIVLFSRFFKKVLDSRRQKVVVVIASIILFIGCILFSLDNVDEWTPLRDFSAVIGETSMWMILYNVLVLATYATCGLSIGCGFLQVTQAAMDTTKDSDMSMGLKRATGRLLRVLEYYFMVVVSVMLARVLLDFFGAIHANPDVELVLNLMAIWPYPWLILGLFVATLKFWRDRKLNTDFSLKRIQKFMAVDKVYIHRVLLVFWFVLGIWVFFLMEFFTPAYPGLTIFSLCMFVGFSVNKEPLGFS